MARVAFPITTFINPDGSPVGNGYLLIRLNMDGSASDTQIQGTSNTRVLLDPSGTITGAPLFWDNASISPSGTYYILSVYSSKGQLVAGPNKVTV